MGIAQLWTPSVMGQQSWGRADLTAPPSPLMREGVASKDPGLVPVGSFSFLALSWSHSVGLLGHGLPLGASHSALALACTPVVGGGHPLGLGMLWSLNGGGSLLEILLLSFFSPSFPALAEVWGPLTCRTGESDSCWGPP